jgi:hypothetical protein
MILCCVVDTWALQSSASSSFQNLNMSFWRKEGLGEDNENPIHIDMFF